MDNSQVDVEFNHLLNTLFSLWWQLGLIWGLLLFFVSSFCLCSSRIERFRLHCSGCWEDTDKESDVCVCAHRRVWARLTYLSICCLHWTKAELKHRRSFTDSRLLHELTSVITWVIVYIIFSWKYPSRSLSLFAPPPLNSSVLFLTDARKHCLRYDVIIEGGLGKTSFTREKKKEQSPVLSLRALTLSPWDTCEPRKTWPVSIVP